MLPSSFKRFRELFRFRMPDDSHWPLFILFPCLCSFHYSSSGHRESDTSEAWKLKMIDRISGHLESQAAIFSSAIKILLNPQPRQSLFSVANHELPLSAVRLPDHGPNVCVQMMPETLASADKERH